MYAIKKAEKDTEKDIVDIKCKTNFINKENYEEL